MPVGKRFFDLVSATILLGASAPVLALAAMAIYLESGRPILFVQTRVGQQGHPFSLYKLRTLPTGPRDSTAQTPEPLWVGRWLRRWALDELPQLWNVLRGDMSLVGPRPILPSEARGYTERQRRRLDVPPGLTGWAQIHGRNALTWTERIKYDLWYVEQAGPWTDLKILFYTPVVLLSGTGVRGPGDRDPSTAEVRQQAEHAPSVDASPDA